MRYSKDLSVLRKLKDCETRWHRRSMKPWWFHVTFKGLNWRDCLGSTWMLMSHAGTFWSWPPCWLLASKFRFWVFGLSFWLVGRGKDGESPQCRVPAAERCSSWAPAAAAGCGRCRRVCSLQQPVQCGGRPQSHRLQPNHWNQGQGRFLGPAINFQILQELQTYCMRSCLNFKYCPRFKVVLQLPVWLGLSLWPLAYVSAVAASQRWEWLSINLA